MDRPRRQPDPIEPNEPTAPVEPNTREENTSPDEPITREENPALDEPITREENQGPDDLNPRETSPEAASTSADRERFAYDASTPVDRERVADDETASPPEETHEAGPDRPTDDAAQRRSEQTDPSDAAQPSADSPPASQEAADRVPAKLRDQMLNNPTFTRLGWGSDEPTEDREDVGAADEQEGAKSTDAALDAAQTRAAEGPTVVEQDDHPSDISQVETQSNPRAETPAPDQSAPDTDEQTETDELQATDVPATADRTPPQEPSRGAFADVVAERDKNWDPTKANLPPGRLPDSAKDLDPEVVEAMAPDVRRLLEYQGAREYIADNVANRPWLQPVVNASPAVQRIFTAIDQGGGHAHIRHGPVGNDQMYADRVAYLEDPAQADDAKRAAGIDGLNPSKMHRCGREATRIHDAEAFVAAFTAAVKLDEVQAALATPVAPTIEPPDSIKVPISQLLGPDGHTFCSGYRLEGGSEAWQARKEWLQARAQGADVTGLPEPSAKRIETFEGGNVIIRFKSSGQNYEIVTLFVEPVADH